MSSESERRARMVEVWRELEPSRAEITAARARFFGSRRGRRSRAVPFVVALATLMVTGMSFAALSLYTRHAGFPQGHTAAPASEDAPTTSSPARRRPPPMPVVSLPPQPTASTVTLTPEELPEAPLEAPAAAPPPLEGSPARTNAPSPSTGGPPSIASATADPASGWSTAAAALRDRDYAGAERAFARLAASADPRTRDEARLARAQLLLSERRFGEARPELEQLAAAGATTLVRQRAADALSILARSANPSEEGTKAP